MLGLKRDGVAVLSGLAFVLLELALVACSDDEAAADQAECGSAVGNWRFGDGNLFMSISPRCEISNFCSIKENIHTRGTATATEVQLDSVGGMPARFEYAVSGEQLTLVAAFQGLDLTLERLAQVLPATCPPP